MDSAARAQWSGKRTNSSQAFRIDLEIDQTIGDKVVLERPQTDIMMTLRYLQRMRRPALVHCSYHKCLTVFYGRVLRRLVGDGYRHFNSDLAAFRQGHREARVASINNRALDLDELGDFRITRLVRDPRDLIVSGYFYHRRGAEPWTKIEDPDESDWYIVNGALPAAMKRGESFMGCLQRLDQEAGLLAEMEFRRHHFDSMRQWSEHRHIRMWRYEDVLGNEPAVIDEMLDHFGMSRVNRRRGRQFAAQFSAENRASEEHVRNPSAGQWRTVFTPPVEEAFMRCHADLLPLLGYQ